MKPSAKLIYAALKRGEVLTPQKALLQFGCMSLSQRVGEINREIGPEKIVSRRVKNEVYNEYYLPVTIPVPRVPVTQTLVRGHVRQLRNEPAGAEPADVQQNLFG